MRAIVAAVILIAGLTTTAQPQAGACGPYKQVAEMLKLRFSEVKIGQGFIGEKMRAELYVSKNQTWTMLIIRPDGVGCVRMAGNYWEQISPNWISY